MALIDICIDDNLDDASDGALTREVKARIAAGHFKIRALMPDEKTEAWCRAGLAADIRQAFYARDANRLEALLAVLERVEAPDA
jgi:hypothetical protein